MLALPSVEDVIRILELLPNEQSRHRKLLFYGYIHKCGLVSHASVGTRVLLMTVETGNILHAMELFERLSRQDHCSWNALIIGCVKHGEVHDALDLYRRMRQREYGIYANRFALVSLLSACTALQDVVTGQQMHSEIARRGLHEADVFIGSSLINMYAKCGSMRKARDVFDKQIVVNVVLWTSLMAGYAEHGQLREIIHCDQAMRQQEIVPDAFAFAFVCKACTGLQDIGKGQEIHDEICRKGLLEGDHVLGSILVDMYAKCGYLEEAVEVFRKLSKKDVVSWTGLVAGYAAFGHHEEALVCYREMQLEGIAPSNVTFISILNCCGSMGALCMGREMHMQVSLRGLEGELFVGNSLIDVYMKCGASMEARAVFDRLPIRDVVSWTALATGHGQLGEIEHIYPILESMWRDGITPDLITFRAVLSACSHAGSVDMADSCFVNLVSCYALLPSCENYNCLIDLLVRAGHIEKALLAMEGMPFHPSAVAWHIILGSCHCWNDAEMGSDAFKHSIQMNEEDTAAYICMSNAYVNAAVADHTSINSPDMSASCM